jgi:hypothetical protein
MPGPSNSLLFEQKDQSLIAMSTEFGSQSFVLETERDVPMSHVAVWSRANEPMCRTNDRYDIFSNIKVSRMVRVRCRTPYSSER